MENYYIKCPVCKTYRQGWIADRSHSRTLVNNRGVTVLCYFLSLLEKPFKTPVVIVSDISGITGDVCS